MITPQEKAAMDAELLQVESLQDFFHSVTLPQNIVNGNNFLIQNIPFIVRKNIFAARCSLGRKEFGQHIAALIEIKNLLK